MLYIRAVTTVKNTDKKRSKSQVFTGIYFPEKLHVTFTTNSTQYEMINDNCTIITE